MIAFIVIAALVIVLIVWLIAIYNRLVGLRNRRENAYADIDVQLKQRLDLIPQLVATVKGYAAHEKELLEKVTQARAGVMQAQGVEAKVQAENLLSSALQGLRVSVEAYPDLKANQNFMQLQEEIADIENKLAASRRFFNSATQELNTAVESFPNSLIASRFGFSRQTLFSVGDENRPAMEQAPVIKL
ncbi:MAG: hypothetical protein RI924_207 [Bacteroidota bacterium]|jgi:LemA protein